MAAVRVGAFGRARSFSSWEYSKAACAAFFILRGVGQMDISG